MKASMNRLLARSRDLVSRPWLAGALVPIVLLVLAIVAGADSGETDGTVVP